LSYLDIVFASMNRTLLQDIVENNVDSLSSWLARHLILVSVEQSH
jgi:hypothetical protein